MVGLALGCNMAWVSMSFKSMNMFASDGLGEPALDAVYLASIIAVAVTLLAAGVFDRAADALLRTKLSVYLLPAGMTVATLAPPLIGGCPLTSACLIGGGVLSGVCSGLFLVRIGVMFSTLPVRSIVAGAATSCISSSLLFTLFLLFGPLEACVFAASMPPVSAFLLEFGMKSFPHAETVGSDDGADGAAPITEPERLDDPSERKAWGALVARLAVCSLLVGFANEATRTLYVQFGIVDSGGTAFSLIHAASSFVVTIVVAAIALVLIDMRSENASKNCYHALTLLLIGGVALLPIPLIYPAADVYGAFALNTASYSCFGMLMWVIVASVCGRYGQLRIRTFAFVRGAWAVGPLLGLLLGRFVLHAAGISLATVFPVMLAALAALLVASSYAFSESDLARAMDLIPLERKQRFRSKCQKACARYGLTEREGEVMVMLAKGRNLPYVQEHLCLSRSTASTRRQHIYQKMDIHSQQELINLVQEM